MEHKHIFVTQRAMPLPRWLESFPDAQVIHPESIEVPACDGAFIWYHLGTPTTEVFEQLRFIAQAAKCPVVCLSNIPSEEEGLNCLEAGVVGYLNALAAPDLLQQVVSAIDNGGLWVGPELVARLRAAIAKQMAPRINGDVLSSLSEREREVALAVAAGASNKEIARNLGITERTVKAHLSAIFERLNIASRLQLSILVNGENRAATSALH